MDMPDSPNDCSDQGPFVGFRGEVQPEWVDVNQHMNVSWYDRVFDAAEKALFDAIGLDEDYVLQSNFGIFRLEKLMRYEKELRLGDRIEVRSIIVLTDHKRIHHFHELMNVGTGARAAFCDGLSIHVDLSLRKAGPIVLARVVDPLSAMAAWHSGLARPAGAVARSFGEGRPR